MGNPDEVVNKVNFSTPRSIGRVFKSSLKDTFFPDDPFRKLKNQTPCRKTVSALQYFIPCLEWAPKYTLSLFKSDLISGITIASLAIPQGISYAKLGNLPPILGLYSSFVPPLIYGVFGSSKDLAVGTVAAASLLLASIIEKAASPVEDPIVYMQLAFTATFFAGVLQTALGFFRLGILVDFLSHSTIVGFMAGTAIIIILQQLKGFLGLVHFTSHTDVVAVLEAVFSQTKEWKWETAVLGIIFLCFLMLTRFLSKKRPNLFWISALSPLVCVISGSLVAYFTHAEKHGVPVIGDLKKGLNPLSITDMRFEAKYLSTCIQAGLIVGFLALCEGIAVGRSFATLRNDQIDGNKEMIAFGLMNIVGSFTSSYLTTGPFSKSAVNVNAGCKTPFSNVVMAIGVMLVLLFLTPVFHYTPLVALSAIITAAMLGLIDYMAIYHLFQVDKIDFITCMSAFLGVTFISMDVGLMISVGISIVRALLYVARPGPSKLGNLPGSSIYRDVEQYPTATNVPGMLILQLGSPLYFANSSYLMERVSRWIEDEEKNGNGEDLKYVILDMGGVTAIDTSGIHMLEEIQSKLEMKEIKVALVNPRLKLMEKFLLSQFIDSVGKDWVFLTIEDAVSACRFTLHTSEHGKESSIFKETVVDVNTHNAKKKNLDSDGL